MQFKKLLLGAAAGFSAGYVAFRAWEALSIAGRTPPVNRDPVAYGRLRRALAVTDTLRGALATLAIAYGPAGALALRAARPLPPWLRPGAVAMLSTLGASIIELGASFVDEYHVEQRFGLSEQTVKSWLADTIKGTALAGVLSGFMATAAAAALRRFPRSWPLIAGIALLPLLIAANIIVPLFVMPLFNRFEPLRGPLEERLRTLASRFGVGDAEILRVDMSRQTKKANAFVTGVGGTHRIVIGDTLIEAFPPEETEFVVAHELGHYINKDTWRSIALSEMLTSLLFVLANAAMPAEQRRELRDQPLLLVRLYAIMLATTQLFRPAFLAFSRSREWAADRFAMAATHDARAGASAFRRLRDQNLSDEDPPLWYELFFSSHPSLKARIAALEATG